MHPERPQPIEDQRNPRIVQLLPFDEEYAKSLPGEFGRPYIASEASGVSRVRSFTAMDGRGRRVGIVQFFDRGDDTNITNTVVDPAFRGMGWAQALKLSVMRELGERHFISLVNLTNDSSRRAMEKIPGVKVVSDALFEKEYGKRKYRYDESSK